MSSCNHLSGRPKGSLGLTISRPSTVINYPPNPFWTSSDREQPYSEILSDFVNIRAPPTMRFLQQLDPIQVSTVVDRLLNFNRAPVRAELPLQAIYSGYLL